MDTVVGLAKSYGRLRDAPEEKVSVTSGDLLRSEHGDLLDSADKWGDCEMSLGNVLVACT